MKYLFLVFAFLPLALLSQEIEREEDFVKFAMGSHTPMLNMMIDQLKLSGDLRTKIEDLWYQHQKEMLDLRYNLEKKEMELMDILRKDDFSIDKFLAKWKEIQQLKNDMELKTLNFKISVYKILPKEKAKDAKFLLFGGKEKIRERMIKEVLDLRKEHKCKETERK